MSSAITLNSNSASLAAQRSLCLSTQSIREVSARLSSGLRINKASDDVAGLAISASLALDSRIYTQAIRNLNDGISYLNIAQGAVSQLSDMLTRIRELSTQASNGTYADSQRQALDNECEALMTEYNRVLESTQFNNSRVFAGEAIVLQAGFAASENITLSLGTAATSSSTSELIANGTFQSAVTYVAGTSPSAMKLIDLNKDGHLDMVTADTGSNQISIYVNLGAGTFQSVATYATTNGPADLAFGDVNADGNVDIMTADAVSSSISVFLGNGSGTFNAGVSYLVEPIDGFPGACSDLALGDLNGDGMLDVVTADPDTYTITSMLNQGDGSFVRGSFAFRDGPATDVALADLNGDNKLDLISTDREVGILQVALGQGNGTFQAPVSYRVGPFAESAPSSLVLGDISGDNKLDIVVTDEGRNKATVFINNGNGSFAAAVDYATQGSPQSVALADFNGDAILDMATVDQTSAKTSVFLNQGNGTFQAAVSYTVGNQPSSISVGDVNEDGIQDLAVALKGASKAAVLLGGYDTLSTEQSTPGSSLLPINGISLSSRTNALSAQATIDSYLNKASLVSGIIGAAMSRLYVNNSQLNARIESIKEASSRISDADIAEESAKLIKTRILQQTGLAVLAQANNTPKLAIDLLSNI